MRHRPIGRGTSLSLVIALLSVLPKPLSAEVRYTVKDLGSLGGSRSGAVSINHDGEVVGYSALPGTTTVHAFLNNGGGMTDLGTFGGSQSFARHINRYEDVVGWAVTSSGERHAFLLRAGVLRDLGTLGSTPVDAWCINDAGDVVGSYLNGDAERAYRWRDGLMEDLGTLGGTDSRAYAVNNSGDVVGFARPIDNQDIHACWWHDGTVTDLGTLGGWASHAYDINDAGKIVGWSMEDPNYISHAFEYVDGVMVDLGTLGGVYSAAFAINNQGLVVGTSTTSAAKQHAVLFDGATMIDLNSLIPADAGWLLTTASDVNDQGLIVGTGIFNGDPRAFLLLPLPGLGADPPRPPGQLEFAGAAPNPVFGPARFGFTLPEPAHVRLRLYDLSGRVVRDLVDRDFDAGPASIHWDGRGEGGAGLEAGVYWARLEAAGKALTRRLTVLR